MCTRQYSNNVDDNSNNSVIIILDIIRMSRCLTRQNSNCKKHHSLEIYKAISHASINNKSDKK